ncbi:hypothetical protein GCM10009662_44650 [Catellatospora coxensis]|uniref:Uncharacterized protein n=1 Tax=Catellatospora coxensis TaxID=310354 RepID=A0A8J3P6K1_9ACTN|nr:hypothetical protein Cco03nite_22990 [Catellatospora coxensis]
MPMLREPTDELLAAALTIPPAATAQAPQCIPAKRARVSASGHDRIRVAHPQRQSGAVTVDRSHGMHGNYGHYEDGRWPEDLLDVDPAGANRATPPR